MLKSVDTIRKPQLRERSLSKDNVRIIHLILGIIMGLWIILIFGLEFLVVLILGNSRIQVLESKIRRFFGDEDFK